MENWGNNRCSLIRTLVAEPHSLLHVDLQADRLPGSHFLRPESLPEGLPPGWPLLPSPVAADGHFSRAG